MTVAFENAPGNPGTTPPALSTVRGRMK